MEEYNPRGILGLERSWENGNKIIPWFQARGAAEGSELSTPLFSNANVY